MLLILTILLSLSSLLAAKERFFVPVTVAPDSTRVRNTPAQAEVDFSALLSAVGEAGEFDRHSVRVEAKLPGSERYQPVDFRLSEHYLYSQSGSISWLITDPKITEFRIWFDTKANPPRPAKEYIPAIGVGDELMFNQRSPVGLFQKSFGMPP